MAPAKKPDKKSAGSLAQPLGDSRNLDINQPSPASSAERAGAINKAKRGGAPEAETEQGTDSLREQQMASRRAKTASGQAGRGGAEKDEKQGKVDAAISKATASMKKGTSSCLKNAWMSLLGGFIPALLWINIHVFLRMVLGEKLFCKLGEEWLGSVPAASTPGGEEANKEAGQAIGIAEAPGLACLDGCCLLLLILIISLIIMIGGFIDNPPKAFVIFLKIMISNL